MGFKAGDEKIRYAPLDWVGFHYYTRRIVSDASDAHSFGGNFSGTEIESDSTGARDPYTLIRAATPTESPLTEAGLEIWPRGFYDLVTQISKE
jgi:beta-glucosidase